MYNDVLSIPVISAKAYLPLSLSVNKSFYNPMVATKAVCLNLPWSTGFYPVLGA